MVVLIVESAPASLRGELTRWMLEPKAGVFVGTLSATVRDLLWEKACREVSEGGAILIHRSDNEQGFAVRTFGDPARQVEQWEGLFLVRRGRDPAPTRQAREEGRAGVGAAMADPISAVWAKTDRGVTLAPGEPPWHPLICHMLDVAMVAWRLWRYVLPSATTAQLRQALGVTGSAEAGRWIAFFAGLHDLGKACPGFALRWPEGQARLLAQGLRPAKDGGSSPHAFVSARVLPEILEAMGLPRGTAAAIGFAVGGHHGLFPSPLDIEQIRDRVGGIRWRDVQRHLAALLARLLEVDGLPPPQEDLSRDNAFLLLLAGITSVADWIGSNHDYFPFVGDVADVTQYRRRARWRAMRALIDLGWLSQPRVVAERSFDQLFDFAPNRLQQQLATVAERLDGPSLVVVESPTGGGKTEGALLLAHHLQARHGQQGLYVALPTMATSNQMFERVASYLARRFPDTAVNVQLLHGRAELQPHYARLRTANAALPDPPVIEDETRPDARLLAAEWFARSKRGLLAPYGIGTVDQALLAALDSKHYFVRLFGLAGKVVILDEVHSYDVYMSSLLERLLQWLAACGASVILLSATLPARKRRDLIAAYGAGRGLRAHSVPPARPYPRVTWLSGSGADALALDGSASRTVALRHWEAAGDSWLPALLAAIEHGGCAAVICNTVRRAQDVYLALCEHLPAEQRLLFHARYPFDERLARETAVVTQFGKDHGRRPWRMVCVATQVIEQSLDIDFDLLVTELAPVDLVLQRCGRVWRLPRTPRPASLDGPECWLLEPSVSDAGVPRWERRTTAVYNTHILLRSHLVLRDREGIRIPSDVESLVEAVYETTSAPADAAPALAAHWRETAERLEALELSHEQLARRKAVPAVGVGLRDRRPLGLDDEDEEAHSAHLALTRLGGPSVEVACLQAREGRLFLRPPADEPFDLHVRPDRETVRRLLGRSLRVGFDPHLVRGIRELPVPAEWQVTPHLRRHRLLAFGPDGVCVTAGLPLRLDPELGLLQTGETEGEA